MKIVDVCAFYAPAGGGVKTYIDRKLAYARSAGVEMVVVAPGPASGIEQRGPGARIAWLRSPRFPLDGKYHYFGEGKALHALLDAEAPDVVEASSPWRSPSMVADWSGDAVRSLVMHADPLAAYAYRWFEGFAERPTIDRGFDRYWRHLRRLDGGFDTVISASHSLSRRLEAGGLRRVVTNPMGIDANVFSPALRDDSLRRRLLALCGLGPDAMLLVGVGRHAPEKRWPMVVSAVMAAQYRLPVALVLVGDGRERGRIAREIGTNPHIRMLAPISDRAEMARTIASADALVHGCEAETFCMVAAEARACGVPLIAPAEGGAADHARASGGLTFEPGSAASAAEAIVMLAGQRSPAGRPRAAVDRTRTMEDHFSELFAHYEALRDRRRAGVPAPAFIPQPAAISMAGVA